MTKQGPRAGPWGGMELIVSRVVDLRTLCHPIPCEQTHVTFPKTRLELQMLTTLAPPPKTWSSFFAVIIRNGLLTLPWNRRTACLTLLRNAQHSLVRTVACAPAVRTDRGRATLILGSRVARFYNVLVLAWTFAATKLE